MSKINISEERLLDEIERFIKEEDYDTLAQVAGELFGGTCFVRNRKSVLEPITFDFIPNEFYSDAFEDLFEKEENIILEPVKETDTNA